LCAGLILRVGAFTAPTSAAPASTTSRTITFALLRPTLPVPLPGSVVHDRAGVLADLARTVVDLDRVGFFQVVFVLVVTVGIDALWNRARVARISGSTRAALVALNALFAPRSVVSL